MAEYNSLHEYNVSLSIPARLQKMQKAWSKINEPVLKHRKKLLDLYASGYYQSGYSREHLINLINRGVSTIVPYLVEGDPRILVNTPAPLLRPWAHTTMLALNYLIRKMNFAEEVLIPTAINSMFGMGITRTMKQYDRTINIDNEVIKVGTPVVIVVDDSNYIGDPSAKRRSEFAIEGDIYQLPTEYAKDLFHKHADFIDSDCKLFSEYNPKKITDPNFDLKKLSFRDYTTFMDIYLRDEDVTVTIMPEGKKAVILREVEEGLPSNKGPYDVLQYGYFPDSPVAPPPAWAWHDLDVTMNILAETARRQAESQKDVIVVEPGNEELGQKITSAKNLDIMTAPNAKDGVNKLSFGGINEQNYSWLNFAEAQFSKTGANPDVLGGRGSQSPTLGQEQMVFANASRVINNMASRFHTFMTSITRKLAWHVWTDPTVYIPVVDTIPGLGQVPMLFSQAEKAGEFYDFVINIKPYSTQRTSPELLYQRTIQFMNSWVLPSMGLAAQQGAMLDIPTLTKQMAEYIELDDFNQYYRTAVPGVLEGVNYTMVPQKGNNGQMDDSKGASQPSREANSMQAQMNTLNNSNEGAS